jgi:hypothetical protein
MYSEKVILLKKQEETTEEETRNFCDKQKLK